MTLKRPKDKGTKGENEVLAILEDLTGRKFHRTPPGCKWDIESTDDYTFGDPLPVINILAIRPDRGEWLFSMTPRGWFDDPSRCPIHVEVKRFATSRIHSIFKEKFS